MKITTKIISFFLSVYFSMITAIGILPLSLPFEVELSELEENIIYEDETFALGFSSGRFSLGMNGKTIFKDAVTEYHLQDRIVSSADYTSFDIASDAVNDNRGSGKTFSIVSSSEALPDLVQHFTFYEGASYFTLKAEISSDSEISTNYIAPVVIRDKNIQNGNPRLTHFLEVPFDNDGWVSFETKNLCQDGLSHEVGAFFTPDDKDGFILGSLTHDKWKSAVEYKSEFGKVDELKVYCGANTALTRDQSPHGNVKGESVASPVFFLGFYSNWKDGMREYARINTTFAPKRKSVTDTNPVGWNSWGAVQTDLNYETAIATSDYIKDNFQQIWQKNGETVYINLDSYWDNMNDEQLRNFVRHCEENNQTAGIYFSPFVSWYDEYGMKNNYVAGTGYTFYDACLTKADGTKYGNDIDGCYPLDVTHPATQQNFRYQLERLMNLGFKYIKLDFLVHGSLEGDFYDDSIQTGIEAYNMAMQMVCDIVGDDVFINLSMAPTFPYNYANGRRLCCDTYYGIDETEYMMNSLTYGFWQSELYDWIDPDHIVLWGKDGKAGKNEAVSRLVSGVVTGGSFLTGDNFIAPAKDEAKADERFKSLLGNEAMFDVLKHGVPFEGVLSADCPYAAETFIFEKDNKTYIALMNYSALPKVKTIDLPYDESVVYNLISAEREETHKNSKTVLLGGKESVIFEISNINSGG